MLSTLRMIQVCDSLFPIGTFTLSNGLETFIAQKEIMSEEKLQSYVENFLQILPYNDLGTMALAHKNADDMDFIRQLDILSVALKNPKEVRLGSMKLCSRFLKISESFEDLDFSKSVLLCYKDLIAHKQAQGNIAIAMGLYARDFFVACENALSIYAYSLLNAIVTNGVKMIPLSQKIGQQILFECGTKIIGAVATAINISLDDLGIGATAMDISCMQHEELYSRLYMS